ncbi:hypothetical protein RUM44_002969 [Polyplax serrata]|uniref:Uncharacterized protein n=1 Tax=Polyplax serrata TaxID=468196 RepID=A0ABR1AX79_POLSC
MTTLRRARRGGGRKGRQTGSFLAHLDSVDSQVSRTGTTIGEIVIVESDKYHDDDDDDEEGEEDINFEIKEKRRRRSAHKTQGSHPKSSEDCGIFTSMTTFDKVKKKEGKTLKKKTKGRLT